MPLSNDEENVIDRDEFILVHDNALCMQANMTPYVLPDITVNFWGNDIWLGGSTDLNVL